MRTRIHNRVRHIIPINTMDLRAAVMHDQRHAVDDGFPKVAQRAGEVLAAIEQARSDAHSRRKELRAVIVLTEA